MAKKQPKDTLRQAQGLNNRNHWYAAILAGGSGTRLWPMSRQSIPKQFLKLHSDQTLLQETYERVAKIIPAERIFVVITEKHEEECRRQLPDIPKDNLIIEPKGKNTAPAIGLVAFHIVRRDSKAIIASLAADHHISKPRTFHQTIEHCYEIAQKKPGRIITVGINPTCPETGYGYIQIGKQFENDLPVYQVKRFVEKPDIKTAQEYFESFEYLWNASYFVFTGSYILKALERHSPMIYDRLKIISQAIGRPEYEKTLVEQYSYLPSEPIDTAVMEKEKNTLVIPADLGWSDIGSWASLHDILSTAHGTDTIVQGHHVGVDTQKSLILAREKLVATVGLRNVIVVDTPDVLLIADKNRAQDVKKIIDRLKEDGKHLYL